MAVHLKVGGGTACKGRGGYRTADVWRVTCSDCKDRYEALDLIERMEERRGQDGGEGSTGPQRD